jgi:UDP-N-acetylglucosamine transferase subunit ALG13
LSFLPAARLLGIPVLYIESAARSNGPSLTGRLISRLPGVGLLAQYPAWAGDRWGFAGSVFDEFAPAAVAPPRDRPLRAVVTLGTIPFPFGRAVEQLLDLLPEDAEVVWQTGHTDAPALGGDARAAVPAAELHKAFRWADLVVAHSGVGSALDALDAGRHPVLLHRDPAHGEHIDDHQVLVASELERRGLATSRRVEDLSRDDLVRATSRGTKHLETPPPIEVPPEIVRLAAPA